MFACFVGDPYYSRLNKYLISCDLIQAHEKLILFSSLQQRRVNIFET